MAAFKRLLFFVSFAGLAASSPTTPTKHTLLVAHQSEGLLTVEFDRSKSALNSLHVPHSTPAGYQPGWICARDEFVYGVSRTQYPHNSSKSGGIFSFGESHRDGSLQTLGHVSSKGEGGVYCDITKDGKMLAATNIDGSTVSIHRRNASGRIEKASRVLKYTLTTPGPGTNESQIQSNPHQSIFDPSGEFMIVPDRGADFVYVYRVSDADEVTQIHNITLPPGTGPRHATFTVVDRTRTLMYLVSELDNTVRVFALDRVSDNCNNPEDSDPNSGLQITLVQTQSTLGVGHGRTAPDNTRLASEVAVSDDGKFFYVANRNTISYESDTLSIFSLHPTAANPLTYLGHNETYGKIPRHFSLSNDPDNHYVAIADEVSNNLMVFKRDVATGFLGKLAGNLTLGPFDETLQKGPMAVIWR